MTSGERSEIDERELWACALQILKSHGAGAPRFVAERIGALALEGDMVGIATWKAIAERLDKIHDAQDNLQ